MVELYDFLFQRTSFPRVLRRMATSIELNGCTYARNCGKSATRRYKYSLLCKLIIINTNELLYSVNRVTKLLYINWEPVCKMLILLQIKDSHFDM